MKKEIRVADEKLGIVQITTFDERWYAETITDPTTNLPKVEFVPSVTWIAGHYPKGIQFYKWLSEHSWDEAEAIKKAAGEKGSKIHLAIADLCEGKTIGMSDKYMNKSLGIEEELSVAEYNALMSYVEWFKEAKPTIIRNEFVVKGDGYAGTVDTLYRREDGRLVIQDTKSGLNIWPEYYLQVSAYKYAIKKMAAGGKLLGVNPEEPIDLEILQVGYIRNKNKQYKVTQLEDKFDLFLAAKQIWANETEGVTPFQKDYPMSISLGLPEKIEIVEKSKPKKKIHA